MRQLFKSLVIASMSIAALASCNKESVNQNPEIADNIRVVEFTTTTPPSTRTVFGKPDGTTVPTLWTSNHTVAVSLNLKSFKQSSTPEVSEDGTTATFNAETEDSETGPYTFYAISPYAALPGQTLTARKGITIQVPTDQTPLENSVDEAAQILVAKTEEFSEFPANAVNFAFKHFTAYGKLSFSNLSLAPGEAVASVALTAEEEWANRFYYYFESDSYEANTASKTITLSTNKTENIWFACAPVDLGGKSVDIVITTDKGTTYSKTITIPAGKTFESGKINSFTVNMSGIKSDDTVEYELVTDASMVYVGRQIIIAASARPYAISTTQNTNNRAQAAVTKTENKITNPGADVEIMTLVAGTKPNTFALSTTDGKYLCAASSSNNYLRTEETLSDNSSWTISIADGDAVITAQGTYTRNIIRYNSTNTPLPIFSCYEKGQDAVSIYAIPDDRQKVTLTFDQEDPFELEANSEEYNSFKPQVASIDPSEFSSQIVYSIFDENGVTKNFDDATGDFELTGTIGTATIAATFAGNEAYRPATAYYTIIISATKPEQPGGDEIEEEITEGTFTSINNTLTLTTDSGITITQSNNGGAAVNSTYNTVSTLRVYRANQLQFTGKSFTKIEMYYTGTYSGAEWNIVNGEGSATIDTANRKVVWENISGATTVTLQNSTANGTNTQLRTTKFVVTYSE